MFLLEEMQDKSAFKPDLYITAAYLKFLIGDTSRLYSLT
jgi:hypothetical protein